MERLAWLMPQFTDPKAAIETEALAGRFIDAAAYCIMAERRLR